MSKLLKQIVETLDLSDFCGYEDLEAISEEGLDMLIKIACEKAKNGWKFIRCDREPLDDCIFRLTFHKDS